MHIDARIICRSLGRYVNVLAHVTDCADINLVKLKATVSDSGIAVPYRRIPCSISHASHGDEFIVALPDVDVDRVTLAFFTDGEGVVAEWSYSPSEAKWRSRANYKIHAALCQQVKDIVLGSDDSPVRFRLLDVIPDDAHGQDIVRFAINSLEAYENALEVRLFDYCMNDLGPVCLMGSNRVPSCRIEGVFEHEMVYSARIAQQQGDIIVSLSTPAFAEPLLFTSIWQNDYAAQRDRTARLIFMNAALDPYYKEWFSLHCANEETLAYQRKTTFPAMPLFSLIVPLFNTPTELFKEMYRSVLAQSYANWELILVNASPENAALSELAEEAASDTRVKVVTLEQNGGISENTNAGLDVATGDFIGFFDHDDVIEPDLLFEYAKAINEHPDTDVLYCDEDKLFPDGSLREVYFKTDFNLDLLRCNNYICHLLTIRTSLLNTLPRNTSEYDGAQDHNLVLHAVERARYVHHVSRVLYHWRATPGSTAASDQNKPYASNAGQRAVEEHLKRCGIDAVVTQKDVSFSYEIQYAVPADNPLVSIIIPTKDHAEVLRTCIDSIFELSTYESFEIVLVDNGSTDSRTHQYYEQLKTAHAGRITIVDYPKPFNFSAMINKGARVARGSYYLLLNNDTEVITPQWIERMLGTCARGDVGAVGVRLYYRDDTVQHAGGFIRNDSAWHFAVNYPRSKPKAWGYFDLINCERDVTLVTAACMMTKRSCFEAVGGFDEQLAVEWNDVDYCLKLREQGLLIVYKPSVELYHFESLSRGYNSTREEKIRGKREKARLHNRWAEVFIDGDPYLNRNFSQKDPECIYHSF